MITILLIIGYIVGWAVVSVFLIAVEYENYDFGIFEDSERIGWSLILWIPITIIGPVIIVGRKFKNTKFIQWIKR